MDKTETIQDVAELIIYEDNILIMRMAKNSNIDIEAAKKIAQKATDLIGDVVHSNLVDIRAMTFMSNEARKFFAGQNKTTVKAVAVLANTSFHRPLINLYLKVSRPSLPTKIFGIEEEAVKWLKESLK